MQGRQTHPLKWPRVPPAHTTAYQAASLRGVGRSEQANGCGTKQVRPGTWNVPDKNEYQTKWWRLLTADGW